MIIRKLIPDDLAEFRRIRLEGLLNAAYAFGSNWQKEQAEPDSLFLARLEHNHIWGVFTSAHELGGIAAYSVNDDEEGTIWGVYVAESLRGTGASYPLMSALINDARLRLSRLTLTVMNNNAPAIQLYRHLGFVHRAALPPSPAGDSALQQWYLKLK
ncbi:GNAT family N-acetyltransferase [Dickeya chrysanthemi]|uniref:GNAT family N-acetyltransferase n=1 Tax=Dickeya chrysanthemi TaxID=556 RepID=A0ABU8JNV3_DICCH